MSDQATWLIVGLGNPGRKYAGTRHNAGFMTIDRLAHRLPKGEHRERFDGWLSEIREPDGRTILLKPKTFMNLSGNSVVPAARWYKVPPERILVIFDDLDLPFGSVRLRSSGSSAGHNGLQSIINRFGNQAIPRLRVGIGHGQAQSARSVAYVLSRFNRSESRHLDEVIDLAAEAAICWRREGIDQAMNMYNGRRALPRAAETRHPTSTE